MAISDKKVWKKVFLEQKNNYCRNNAKKCKDVN